jgi:hypothetical protein
VSQSEDGMQFLGERASNLSTNYQGAEMESAALNKTYSDTASQMLRMTNQQALAKATMKR